MEIKSGDKVRITASNYPNVPIGSVGWIGRVAKGEGEALYEVISGSIKLALYSHDFEPYNEPFSATEAEQELLLAIRAGKIAMPEMPKPKQQVTQTCSAWVFPKEPFHATSVLHQAYAGSVPCIITAVYEV